MTVKNLDLLADGFDKAATWMDTHGVTYGCDWVYDDDSDTICRACTNGAMLIGLAEALGLKHPAEIHNSRHTGLLHSARAVAARHVQADGPYSNHIAWNDEAEPDKAQVAEFLRACAADVRGTMEVLDR